MAKQLDEKTILNELRGESAFFQSSPPQMVEPAAKTRNIHRTKARRGDKTAVSQSPNQLADNYVDQSANQPVSQPVDQLASRMNVQSDGSSVSKLSSQAAYRHTDEATDSLSFFDMSPILPRDKSFYITEKQDNDLNILVKKLSDRLNGKVEQKIDRSLVARLIFEEIGMTSDETVDRLASLLIKRLTNQLNGGQDD